MNQQRESPAAQAAQAARVGRPDQASPVPGLDLVAVARGGTWLRDGTPIRVPPRARLALVRPQMLKAQAGRPAGSGSTRGAGAPAGGVVLHAIEPTTDI